MFIRSTELTQISLVNLKMFFLTKEKMIFPVQDQKLLLSPSFISALIFMISSFIQTLGFFVLLFLVALGVSLGCLFDGSLVSWQRLVLLKTSLLALLLMLPIGFELTCFHSHLLLGYLLISSFISSVTSWLFRSVLFRLHMFVSFSGISSCSW